MNEDDMSDVYEDYLAREDDRSLLTKLTVALVNGKSKLCGHERVRIISMIQNIDYTGKLDYGFEDRRESMISNNHCG